MKERIERPMPTTIEGCQAEVSWMRKKVLKVKRYATRIGVICVILGMIVCACLGYYDGYHHALVDFGIIAGIIY